MSNYSIVTTRMGATSIRDNVTQEIMHNPVGPWLEANSLYIEQSQLARRLTQDVDRELVVFDVGLGAAANSLATLHCLQNAGMQVASADNIIGSLTSLPARSRRHLRLISYERDLTLLQFALDHADQFEHFKGFENAVQSILDHGLWEENSPTHSVRWELRHGDFLEQILREQLNCDLVFFDPYSSLKNPEMWSAETFKKVFDRCNKSDEGALLLTYSRATPVRVAMLHGGFFVGVGHATGAKEETTQASTRLESLAAPLSPDWLKRRPHIDESIYKHSQFNLLPGALTPLSAL